MCLSIKGSLYSPEPTPAMQKRRMREHLEIDRLRTSDGVMKLQEDEEAGEDECNYPEIH